MSFGAENKRATVYTRDLWEHACPVIRLSGPLTQAGFEVVNGLGSQDPGGDVEDIVRASRWVVIARDFPSDVELYQKIYRATRQAGVPLVYEIDDILTEIPGEHPDYTRYALSRPGILHALQNADAVTVSTARLQEYISALNPKVYLLPNCLDDGLWRVDSPAPRPAPADGCLVIGYFGTHSHKEDLEMIQGVLARLLQRYAGKINLQFWGIQPPAELQGHPDVAFMHGGLVEYAAFAEYFQTQQIDIAIAPLQDTFFNRFKSGIKFLEYSAMGIPGVYSRIDAYAPLVEEGRTGFLAGGLDEWEAALARLIEDPGLRRAVGEQAGQALRARWLLSRNAGQWKELYEALPRGQEIQRKPAPEISAAFELQSRWFDEVLARLEQTESRETELKAALSAALARAERSTGEQAALKVELAQAQERENVLQAELGAALAQAAARAEELNSTLAAAREQADLDSGELRAAREELDYLRPVKANLDAITHSPGWRMLEMVYAVRLALIPRGSLRERLLKTGFRALSVLKNEGLKSFLRKLRGARLPSAHSQPAGRLETRYSAATPAVYPCVSLVLLQNSSVSTPARAQAEAWLGAQSLAHCELVLWDAQTGVVEYPGQDLPAQTALEPVALVKAVHGKYLAFVSQALLGQGETYLERNWVVLETEGLAFTFNLNGANPDLIKQLKQRQLENASGLPLDRMVVNRHLVRENWQIDLEPWTGRAAAKLLLHTHSRVDGPAQKPSQAVPWPSAFELAGEYILPVGGGVVPHNLYPLETFLQPEPLSFDKPVILVVMPFLAVGGAERILLDGVQGLSGDARFVILTLEPHNPELGNMVDAFRQETPYVYALRDFLNPGLDRSFIHYLMQRFNPVCLYVANGTNAIYDMLPELRQRYPRLCIANQVYDYHYGWINRYDRILAEKIDIHIGANERICEEYVRRGVNPKKTRLIESGVSVSAFSPHLRSPEQVVELKKAFGLPLDKKIVTFIARLNAQKRPVDFLELARRCEKDEGLYFLMVGDGPLGPVVEENIQRLKLTNLLRKPFYKPSLDVFALTDVLVLPSEFEGMPMVILEAQSMGKPVVATDVGNNCSVLEKTGGGEVIRRIGDIEALRQAVLRVLDDSLDPDAIRAMVIKHYSLEKEVGLYREALLGKANA